MSAERDEDASSGERDRVFSRAVATSEFAIGLAHALNNAFTVIAGEASFVQSERKDDPLLDEACASILEQVTRCARMTRALQLRREETAPAVRAAPETHDVVRALRDVAAVLDDSLSRRIMLSIETPEDELLVCATADDLQTAWLLLAHEATARVRGGGRVVLCAGAGANEVVLTARAVPNGDAPLRTPATTSGSALDALARRLGGRCIADVDPTTSTRNVFLARIRD